jgi:hypothetical protein
LLNLYNSIDGEGTGPPTGATEESLNPHLMDPGVDEVFTYYWSSHDWTPNFDNLYRPDITGTTEIVDLRQWQLFFDVFDDAGATEEDSGVVTMSYAEVRTIERPADTTGTEMTDFTSSNNWAIDTQFQTANVDVIEDLPSAGLVTFSDDGPINGTEPTYLVYQRPDTLSWGTDSIARVSAWISCPTTTDRDQFHRFRIRHQGDFLMISQVFQVRQNFADQGNPMSPIARDGNDALNTKYETYIHMRGGPSSFLSGNGVDAFLMSLDQLHNVANLSGGTQDQAAAAGATRTTVHKVLQEMLPVSAFAAGESN